MDESMLIIILKMRKLLKKIMMLDFQKLDYNHFFLYNLTKISYFTNIETKEYY